MAIWKPCFAATSQRKTLKRLAVATQATGSLASGLAGPAAFRTHRPVGQPRRE